MEMHYSLNFRTGSAMMNNTAIDRENVVVWKAMNPVDVER
eukprot:CAMPEP_0184688172 /NCGR_PEP_ID=MMETSP0312-20130426/28843_1 /TAXON_ID=31354 /ORGANISM="Compsopogon coeruleus, Strain SAG 36.94" /LENGTH=39 /DNA_ID= /DNA_START= /DNA_END= /DNA_ORIENTATION=